MDDPNAAATFGMTARQQRDLHVAIAAYFWRAGYGRALDGFREDLAANQRGDSKDKDAKDQDAADLGDAKQLKVHAGLLSKKWTSIVHLQRKLMPGP